MVSPGRDKYFMKESDPKDIGIRKGTLTLPDGGWNSPLKVAHPLGYVYPY